MEGFGFEIEEKEIEGLTDDDEVPEDVNPVCQLGQIWKLGEHRVMCGDSTKAEDVAKLMDGEKADVVFTSPPYNQGNGGMKYDYHGKIEKLYRGKGDKKTGGEYVDFLIGILGVIKSVVNKNSAIFWNVMYNANSRSEYGEIVFSEQNKFLVRETIIWDKGHSFPTASKGIMSRRCELIFLMSIDKYYTNQGENEPIDNYWRISSTGSQQKSHKACFPVELPIMGINLCSNTGSVILDPFLGSGSTLIAAEKTNRKCYGMEIDPHYCDVIIKRWEDFTGNKAELVK